MNAVRSGKPALALVLLSLIWGYNWVVMKQALRFIDPLTFSALRSILGALAVFVLLLTLKRSFSPGSFLGVLILGLIQTTAFVTVSATALMTGGAGKTAVLVYTMPLWLLVLAWPALGERIKGMQWVAVVLAGAGLLLVLQPWRLQANYLSVVLALFAALCWAVSGIWVKRLRARVRIDLLPLTAWQLLLGSIPLVIFAGFQQAPVTWSSYLIGALIYNAIPATALAWLLWLYALNELPAGIAGMGTLMTPLVGVLAAWFQLGERPGLIDALGMVGIFGALTVLVAERLGSGGGAGRTLPTRSSRG
jgi:drug/metabolite transporter (DMT)-like permease